MKNAIILTHLGMGDVISISPAIRYFANKYENVYIVSKSKSRYFENCMKMYEDIDNINILTLSSAANDNEYQERVEVNQFLNNFEEDYDLLTCGIYHKDPAPFNILPDNFYIDLGLDLNVYENYFTLSESIYKNQQFKEIIEKYEYAFVCGKTSLVDHTEKIVQKIDKNILLLSPSKNLYSSDHQYFGIAESIVGLPMFDYVPLIQNAQEIHLIASSFSILSKFVASNISKKYLYNYTECGLSSNFFKDWKIIDD
jgi:hypothetical protein